MYQIELFNQLLSTQKQKPSKAPSKTKLLTLPERESEFKALILKEFGNKISNNTIKEFTDYWVEHSINSNKMRFEKEKAFDIQRRMQTWMKNNNKIMPAKNGYGASGFNIGN